MPSLNAACEFIKVVVCCCCKSDLRECVDVFRICDLGGRCVATGVLPWGGARNFMQTTIPTTIPTTRSMKAAMTPKVRPRIPAMLNPVPVDLGVEMYGGNVLAAATITISVLVHETCTMVISYHCQNLPAVDVGVYLAARCVIEFSTAWIEVMS